MMNFKKIINLSGLLFVLTSCGETKINQYTVTFKQQNQPDIVLIVNEGDNVDNLPTLTDIEGYTSSWEDVDLTNIHNDIVVNAIYTIKQFTLVYDVMEAKGDSYLNIEYEEKVFDYNTEFTLLIPSCQGYVFECWMLDGTRYDYPTYVIKSDVTFEANWTVDTTDPRWWTDNF